MMSCLLHKYVSPAVYEDGQQLMAPNHPSRADMACIGPNVVVPGRHYSVHISSALPCL